MFQLVVMNDVSGGGCRLVMKCYVALSWSNICVVCKMELSVPVLELSRPYNWLPNLFPKPSIASLVLTLLSRLAKVFTIVFASSISLASLTILSLLLFIRFSSVVVVFSLALPLRPTTRSIKILTPSTL